ncbi:MAG: 50S ribosomal protein L3 [Candidatus Pacearchaeota archaeon]|nr:50S ribosomal protein L3 [Candidatus Pacearchaeota archaeon]
MGKIHKPRAGSLQFWPRKRAKKILPRVNWIPLEEKYNGLLGFIAYKASMLRVLAIDMTPDSMSKNKQVVIPVTALEVPPMKIFSVRFYKKTPNNYKVVTEVLSDSIEKEMKRKVKIPKQKKHTLDEMEKKLQEFDNIRIIVYSLAKKTKIKKTPDIVEVGLGGSINEKFDFVKKFINKELHFEDFFQENQLVDVRGVTKGKGTAGPVKRFGIGLKAHKTEKGRRRPGSLGPWIPSRVTFRVAQAGQLGFFTRVEYNKKILKIGKGEDLHKEIPFFDHFGNIKTTYLLLKGSVPGPSKRQLLLTVPLRETKKTKKERYEILKIVK